MRPNNEETHKEPQRGQNFLKNPENRVTKQTHHVVRRDDGWAVVREGSSIDAVRTATQQEAISKAHELASSQSSEVIIHGRDGRIAGREIFTGDEWEFAGYSDEHDVIAKYIDFKHFGERPHIRGRRIWVSMIAANAETNQWSISRLAYEFTLSEEEVLAALLYYREHKNEIDRQDEEDKKLWHEMKQQSGDI